MSERIQIDWSELRRFEGNYWLYFMEATRMSRGWRYKERAAWEVVWYDVRPSLRLAMTAEHGLSGVLHDVFPVQDDLYLMQFDGDSYSELWLGLKDEAAVANRNSGVAKKVAVVRFSEFRWLHGDECDVVRTSEVDACLAWR